MILPEMFVIWVIHIAQVRSISMVKASVAIPDAGVHTNVKMLKCQMHANDPI